MQEHDQKALFCALKLAKTAGVTDQKPAMPVLTCVAVAPDHLRATNLASWLRVPLGGQGAGEVVAPLTGLLALVEPEGKLSGSTTLDTLSQEDPNQRPSVRVAASGLSGELAGYPSSEYPVEPTVQWDAATPVPVSTLLDALDFVLPACCTYEGCPHIAQIMIQDGTITATDGRRAARCLSGIHPKLTAQLPRGAAVSAMSLLKQQKRGEVYVAAGSDEQHPYIRLAMPEAWTWTARCYAADEHQFPEVDRVIPDRNAAAVVVTIDAAKLSAALGRIGKVKAQTVRLTLHEGAVLTLAAMDGACDLSVGIPAGIKGMTSAAPPRLYPDGSVDLPGIPEGSPVGVNRGFLEQAIPKRGEITLRCNSPINPIRVDWSDELNRVAVIGPTQLQ